MVTNIVTTMVTNIVTNMVTQHSYHNLVTTTWLPQHIQDPCQASEVELLAKIFIVLKLLTIFEKRFPSEMLDRVLNTPLGEE